ncbi:MAG: hypothetical protein R3B06_16350 [Kofleriaceae bacterium]
MRQRSIRLSIATCLLASACNQVFGLDPVSPPDAAVGADAEVDADISACVANTTQPEISPSLLTSPAALAVGGATRAGTAAWAVATTDTTISSDKDGYLLRLGGGDAILTVHGNVNDQLWRIAGTTDVLAVGITRSALTMASDGDDGLLVKVPSVGSAAVAMRLDDTASATSSVKITAVAELSDGWVVAGDHTRGAFLVDLDQSLHVRSARLLVGGADLRIRHIAVNSAGGVAMIGSRSDGAVLIRTALAPGLVDAQVFSGMSLSDVAWIGQDLVAVGRTGPDGVRLTLDTTTNVPSAARLPGRPLQRVIDLGDHWVVGGTTASGALWVGEERGDCVGGFDHADVVPTAVVAGPMPLAQGAGSAMLVGSPSVGATAVRFVPLGEGGASACGQLPWVAAYEALALSSTGLVLTVEAPPLATSDLSSVITITSTDVTPSGGC